MKRLSWPLVSLVFLLPLTAGCGGNGSPSAASNSSDAAANSDNSTPYGGVGRQASSAGFTPTVQAAGGLRYRFEQGKNYAYKIHVEADLGEMLLVTQAGCNYSVGAPDQAAAEIEKPPTVTGTAFVVHADGYLLTCEHVVADSQKIDVALGGRTYTARVLAVDEALDLALLKIEARGLPVLPLGNSESVRVGEEVRAIGFPLSSVLGNSAKTTRGSVSGIERFDGRRTFQIDASVNGGNSGGPVVGEGGHVLGVVNAKLTGEEISNIGFAVPIDYAKKLLADRKVKFTAAKGTEKLDGPTLVKKVNPSVALVTTTLGNIAAGGTYNLRAAGHIRRSERQKRFTPGRRPTLGSGANVFFGARTPVHVKVDSQGDIHEFDGEDALPFMLGYAPLVIFEPLPTDGRRSWKTQQQIVLHSKSSDDSERNEPGFGFRRPSFSRRGPIGPRFGPGARRDEPAEPQVKYYPALEVVSYRIEAENGDLVTIRKQYEMKTTAANSDSLALETTGSGTITFDTKVGLPTKFDYQGSFSIKQGLVSVEIPFKATYELADSKPATPTPPAARTKPATPAPAKPATVARPTAPRKPDPAEPDFKALPGRTDITVWAPKWYQKYTPELAFDGDLETFWNAGGWPEQWIEVDLLESKALAGIKLTMPDGKSRPGETIHEIWVSDKPLGPKRSEGRIVHTFQGVSKWGDVLQADFPASTTARYVQIRSTKSRSWIAWGEIDIRVEGK